MGTLYYSDKLGSVMRAFMAFLGPHEMMAPRLVELCRALNLTASHSTS